MQYFFFMYLKGESMEVDVSYGGSFLWRNIFFPWVAFIQMLMVINISLD